MDNGTGQTETVEIVLVEDSSDDVALTLNALKKARFINKIHVLNDGEAALKFLLEPRSAAAGQQGSHRLVLLDLNLPKIHGLDVLRKIKADERTKSIPVIILTASQEERGVMQSYKLGAQGCIVKPFEFNAFVETVAELPYNWALVSKKEI